MTEIEPNTIAMFMHTRMLPEAQRRADVVASSKEALKAPLKVLNDQLSSREYLLGNDFTVADLNVASVVGLGAFVGVDFGPAPKAKAWLDKCNARPASAKARTHK